MTDDFEPGTWNSLAANEGTKLLSTLLAHAGYALDEMPDDRVAIIFEEARQDTHDHIAVKFLTAEGRGVLVGGAGTVLVEKLLLGEAAHCGHDGGIGDFFPLGEGFVDGTDGGRALLPHDIHYLSLKRA
jgi:hypothetical protein